MAKKITKIPATLNQYSLEPTSVFNRRNVAGYARVSTDRDEQATSYETQRDYYERFIKSKPEWNFVGIYADEGISATSIKRREGFQRMIADALDGKIDLIITKSISRFARNTVDTLVTVRQLKEKGIEVYFEKENIWTLDSKGELIITIMSSIAQEESRSISENVKWGKRKMAAKGQTSVSYSTFLGYDKDFKINEEEASVVRFIYKSFLGGSSMTLIAKELEKQGIPSPGGKKRWHPTTIKSILTNEKYKGDALIQKFFVADFLTKKVKVNEGEVPQYYVKEHHEPIIDPAVFDLAQEEIRRGLFHGARAGGNFFSGIVKCGYCGAWYGRKVWHSNDPEHRRFVLQCNDKYKVKGHVCPSHHITEAVVEEAFGRVVHKLIQQRTEIVDNINLLIQGVGDITHLQERKAELETEMKDLIETMKALVQMSVPDADSEERIKKRYEECEDKLKDLHAEIVSKVQRKTQLEEFLEHYQKIDCKEFDEYLWQSLVEYVVAEKDKSLTFVLRSGIQMKA